MDSKETKKYDPYTEKWSNQQKLPLRKPKS